MVNNNELENRGWDDMKAILDRNMPEKKRRILPIFWYLSAISAVIIFILLYKPQILILPLEHKAVVKKGESETYSRSKKTMNKANENLSIDNKKTFDKGNSREIYRIVKDNNSEQIKLTDKLENSANPEGSVDVNRSFNVKESHVKQDNDIISEIKITNLPSYSMENDLSGKNIPPVNSNSSNRKELNTIEPLKEDISTNSKVDIASESNVNESKVIAENAFLRNRDQSFTKTGIAADKNMNLASTAQEFVSEITVGQDPPKAEDVLTVNQTSSNSDNKILNPAPDLPRNVEFEKLPGEPVNYKTKSKFYAEAGLTFVFIKGFGNNYHIGLRYDLVQNNRLKIQVGASGLNSPSNIKYTITNYTVDANNRVKVDNVENTIKSLRGLNGGGFFQYQVDRKGKFYVTLNPGISFLSLQTSGSSQEMLSGPTLSSKDATQSGALVTASSIIKTDQINLFTALGIGYTIKNFGLEIYYSKNQNGLRNSGLANYNTRWLDLLGVYGIYRF